MLSRLDWSSGHITVTFPVRKPLRNLSASCSSSATESDTDEDLCGALDVCEPWCCNSQWWPSVDRISNHAQDFLWGLNSNIINHSSWMREQKYRSPLRSIRICAITNGKVSNFFGDSIRKAEVAYLVMTWALWVRRLPNLIILTCWSIFISRVSRSEIDVNYSRAYSHIFWRQEKPFKWSLSYRP